MEQLRDGDPSVVGRCTVLARLGAGAGGVVYLARSPGGRPVAVKVIHPHLTRDPEFRRRFDREVQALRAVGGFHTAAVIDAGWSRSMAWLTTEYVPAPSLERLVATGGPLPIDATIGLGRGIAEALRAIHAAGVVHRDLKPSNVLVTLDGPRVIDFGVAGAVGSATLTAGVLGTPGFLAPEQAMGEFAGPAGDVFALGAMLVFASTGRGPFGDGEAATLVYRTAHAAPDLGAMPESPLRGIAAACLARDPRIRPTPDALLTVLPDLEFRLPPAMAQQVATYGPNLPAAPPRPRRRLPLLLGALVGALILVAGTVFAIYVSRDDARPGAVATQTTVAPTTPAPAQPKRIPIDPLMVVKELAFSADERQLFVTGSDRVVVIDSATNAVVHTTSIAGASDLVVSPDGARIYAFQYNADVQVYNTNSGARLASIPATNATFAIPSRDGTRLYMQYDKSLVTVDTATNAIVGQPIPVPRQTAGGAVTPDGTRLYAVEYSLMTDPENRIGVVDLTTGTVPTTIDVAGRARALALSTDGRRAAVINWADGHLSLIDTATNAVIGTTDFDQRAADVALSPDGSRAYVSIDSAATILVIDPAAGTVLDRLRVDRSPDSLVLSADGRRLYVACRDDDTVMVVPVG